MHDRIPDPCRLLIVGINPGRLTEEVDAPFAYPGNRFWPALEAAGITPYRVHANEGLSDKDAAMLAGAVIQPHPDEAHVIADRAVEPVAAHVDFRIGRQLEIHRRERAVGIAGVDAGKLAAHRIGELERGIPNAERFEDPRLEDLAEPPSGDRLDDLAAPIHVGAVFPALAGIEQQRCHQRGLGRRDDARLPLLLRKAVVGVIDEIVAEACTMDHQHAGGDVALRRTEAWLALVVKALDDLKPADVGCVGLGRRVEIELAFLDELQNGGARDRLGGREDGEHAVGRHVGRLVEPAFARGAFVDVAMPVGHHRNDAGDAWI